MSNVLGVILLFYILSSLDLPTSENVSTISDIVFEARGKPFLSPK
ncbi:MAG: hypothetical protein WAL24_08255 [Nitrososphaeraceae archaeon]